MSADERMTWAREEARLRARLKFDPVAERLRERQVGATSAEANRAVRKFLKGAQHGNGVAQRAG